MKRIKAIIPPVQLDGVKAALEELEPKVTAISEAKLLEGENGVSGHGSGTLQVWRAMVEVVVENDQAVRTVEVIAETATVAGGRDGKVFVLPHSL